MGKPCNDFMKSRDIFVTDSIEGLKGILKCSLNCSVRGQVSSSRKRFGHHQWLNWLCPSCPITWLLKAVNSVH